MTNRKGIPPESKKVTFQKVVWPSRRGKSSRCCYAADATLFQEAFFLLLRVKLTKPPMKIKDGEKGQFRFGIFPNTECTNPFFLAQQCCFGRGARLQNQSRQAEKARQVFQVTHR